MRTLWLALVICLFTPSLAQATEGLRWKWTPDVERRYLIRSNVRFPELFPARARQNKDLRLAELQTTMVVRCKMVAAESKRVAELACSLDDVQFRGAPPAADAHSGITQVLDEWDAALTEVTLQMRFSYDGYVRNVDIEGYDARTDRLRKIQEHIRLVVTRSLAGLELGLPRKGDDRGQAWVQKDTAVLQLPSVVGSFGTARLVTKVTHTEGSVVTIERMGDGSIRSGDSIGDPSQGERARNTFVAEMRGTATFDTELGELVTSDYAATAEATASSALATGVASPFYVQLVTVKRLTADRKVELGVNEETVPGENGI